MLYGNIDNKEIWVMAYVDDLLIISEDCNYVKGVNQTPQRLFILKDLCRAL